jgi:hypothetical protein
LSGAYHLYYQGSDSYRTEFDPTVCHRSIGLSVETQALEFEKYENNPVLTWLPNGECEEGAAAGAAIAVEGHGLLMYFGANSITSRTTVSADVRLSRSIDGKRFGQSQKVLDHLDANVWGNGDELFPILALKERAVWILYYVANGVSRSRRLGVAWGTSPELLDRTSEVRDPSGDLVPVWGPAGSGVLREGKLALFLKNGPDGILEARTVFSDSPSRVSERLEAYPFEDVRQATVVLDSSSGRWLMFYRGSGHYGLKTAPIRTASAAGPEPT